MGTGPHLDFPWFWWRGESPERRPLRTTKDKGPGEVPALHVTTLMNTPLTTPSESLLDDFRELLPGGQRVRRSERRTPPQLQRPATVAERGHW